MLQVRPRERGLGTRGQKLAGTTIGTTRSSSPALHIDFVTGPSSRLGGCGDGRGEGGREYSADGGRGESDAVQFWRGW